MSTSQNTRSLPAKVYMFCEQKDYKSLYCYELTIITKTFTKGEECFSLRKQLQRLGVHFPDSSKELAQGTE